jgi:AAA15 family ATPase/GTPase
MITNLSVSNFKSVRHLDIECKKINLFIGEPNTGKSNILEALGLLGWLGQPGDVPLRDSIRFETMPNLFYDQLLDHEILINASTSDESYPTLDLSLKHDNSMFRFRVKGKPFRLVSHRGDAVEAVMISSKMAGIRFFRFKKLDVYGGSDPGSLKPPDGANLFSVVISSDSLRRTMADFFQKYGLKLVMKPNERVFELQKQLDDLVFSYPYNLTSDTLQRIIFYTIAMASNKDSTLVFEEPESNAFPYYTKYLGERIALDETNQFFIATHNPYLLSAVIEKAPRDNVQIFVTYFEDYETHVKPLTPGQLSELMEADPFFNLDRFIEEGQ